ncbi:response regulator transcription factor [Streptomyces sp. NRRL S-87]|uniref:response regulator n=1 Tax=Streptomyces sp. NRRL S-87 TaxID=1463920 RepID=UPI0004C25B9D|nr:response regulator transcription factor [Streptomyces sp. NRRL S-87]
MTTTPIRVMIADDQVMVRQGFTVLLNAQSDIEVVGQAVDGADAIEKVAELAPDVVLMDIRMPGVGGIEATARITGAPGSTVKVLVLTTFDLDEYVYEALRSGASGFLLKDASAEQLAEAVRVIAAGEALLAPNITKRLITEFSRMGAPRGPLKERLGELTERETEVLVLVAQGLSNAEIAQQLMVAEQTVKTHVSRILVKLNLRDRTQAAVHAYETGLIRPTGY